MAIRTTIDIPEPLHERLRHRAERSGTSIRALVIRALEQVYGEAGKEAYVTGPLVAGPGKLGRNFPRDKNPHNLVFS
jgi:hypothetical protein